MVITFDLFYRRVGLIFCVVKMDDIECHPEASFRDPGSSFQVSARPKRPDEPALEVGGDITDKVKVRFAPDHSLDPDIEDGYSVERRTKGESCFCGCDIM